MNIAIGNDHAGVAYKQAIITALQVQGHQVLNCGTDTPESVDYPDFGHAVARAIEEGKAQVGIVICGSGNGIAMTVNKHASIRCALCWTKEIAALARAITCQCSEYPSPLHRYRAGSSHCRDFPRDPF